MGSARRRGDTNFETNSLSGMNVSGNAPSVQGSIKRLGRYGMRSDLDRYISPISYRTRGMEGRNKGVVGQRAQYHNDARMPFFKMGIYKAGNRACQLAP
jgi:hypothetical protein